MSAVQHHGLKTSPVTAPVLASRTRSGPSYWLSSLEMMLRFDFGRARDWGAMMAVIPLMMGAGMGIMYGFFYPAPRRAQATSTFLLYTLLSLPGAVLALVVASWRYGAHLSISPLIVPAVLLCALMAISVGFGMALAIPNPMITNLIANALVFMVLLFSPIVFPPANMPGWLFAAHRVLPFYNMAVVIRAGLTTGLAENVTRSFLVLAAWTLAGFAATAWVVGHRR